MIEVLKKMVEALEWCHGGEPIGTAEAIKAGKKAIKALEGQEPVAWLLTEKNINSLQVDSIELLINRLKHAHHTDLCVRINGQDEWFQADWLKHMVRVNPPHHTWVGLAKEDRLCAKYMQDAPEGIEAVIDYIESKLKELNT